MQEHTEYLDENRDVLKSAADILFTYLRDAIYDSSNASLDLEQLPEEFRKFGQGLQLYNNVVVEMTALAKELAAGNLNCQLPPPSNEIAAPLKTLHASLKHLTWQTQQVAKGDYQQRVDFMGDFSEAFNNMIEQLRLKQKTSLEEKSRLELHMDLILSNCPDLILLFERQGKLAYASNSCLRFSKTSGIEEILGKQVQELFAPVASAEFIYSVEKKFKTAIREERTVELEQDLDFTHQGSCSHYHIQIIPILKSDKEAEGIMMLLHDMTELERIHQAEHAREIAEQSSQAKSEFLARMSHEMRTPMNAIIGMTTIYNSTDDPKRKDYCIDKINEASKHLLGVINDVLDMSKIEADKFEIFYSEFNLKQILKRITGVMLFQIEEHKQQLLVNVNPNIPELVVTDEQRLAQVVTNLLSNAVKFTPDGGEISLAAEKVSDENNCCVIRFTVKDNGIGISKEQQKRLFVPFEQADGSISRKFGGTGLGLSISKHIVEMLGGNIRTESEMGKGSSFIFEIPVETPESSIQSLSSEKDVNEVDMQEGTDSSNGIFSDRRILLAEDVEINREILFALLEHTGIYIDSAEDGKAALEKFTAAPDSYDLILMDIHMPNMDGYETTTRIRESGLIGADSIPIVAMTANVFREDIERCLSSGMNSHLGKPLDEEEVIAQLKEYLW